MISYPHYLTFSFITWVF